MKKCKSCQTEIDEKAMKCPHCQTDQRNWFGRHKILTGILVLIVISFTLSAIGSKESGTGSSVNTQSTQIAQKDIVQAPLTPTTAPKEKVNVADLMKKNDPDVKRLNFATADYIGQSFTLYTMSKVSDYYNYGFRDELKYYSFVLWDTSVKSEYEGVYAYIDKTKPERKGKELFDILLKGPTFVKMEVSIPAEKYEEHSNAFLEINSWGVLSD